MAPFRLEIVTGSTTPIYRQIVEQVRVATATGKLKAGDGLTSVRRLAEELLINPNTVAKAYGELAREGVVESRQGLGVFVAPKRRVLSREERRRRLEQALDVLTQEALCLDFTAQQVRQALDKRLRKWPSKETA